MTNGKAIRKLESLIAENEKNLLDDCELNKIWLNEVKVLKFAIKKIKEARRLKKLLLQACNLIELQWEEIQKLRSEGDARRA